MYRIVASLRFNKITYLLRNHWFICSGILSRLLFVASLLLLRFQFYTNFSYRESQPVSTDCVFIHFGLTLLFFCYFCVTFSSSRWFLVSNRAKCKTHTKHRVARAGGENICDRRVLMLFTNWNDSARMPCDVQMFDATHMARTVAACLSENVMLTGLSEWKWFEWNFSVEYVHSFRSFRSSVTAYDRPIIPSKRVRARLINI